MLRIALALLFWAIVIAGPAVAAEKEEVTLYVSGAGPSAASIFTPVSIPTGYKHGLQINADVLPNSPFAFMDPEEVIWNIIGSSGGARFNARVEKPEAWVAALQNLTKGDRLSVYTRHARSNEIKQYRITVQSSTVPVVEAAPVPVQVAPQPGPFVPPAPERTETAYVPTSIVPMGDRMSDPPYRNPRHQFIGRVKDWQLRPDGSVSNKATEQGGWYFVFEDASLLRQAGLNSYDQIRRAWVDHEGTRYVAETGYSIYLMLDSLTGGVLYSVERIDPAGQNPPEVLSFMVRGPTFDQVQALRRSNRTVPPARVAIVRDPDGLAREDQLRAAAFVAPEVRRISERIKLRGDPSVTARLQAFMDGDFDTLDQMLTDDAQAAVGAFASGSAYYFAVRTLEDTRYARLITAYGLIRTDLHGDCGEPMYPLQWSTTRWTEYRNGFGQYRGRSEAVTTTQTIDVPIQLAPAFQRVDTVEIDRDSYDALASVVEQIGCRTQARKAIEANMAAYFRREEPFYVR